MAIKIQPSRWNYPGKWSRLSKRSGRRKSNIQSTPVSGIIAGSKLTKPRNCILGCSSMNRNNNYPNHSHPIIGRTCAMEKSEVNRRDFLKVSAAGATALSLSAAAYGRVRGANDDINIAFLGVGGRCQEHIGIVTKFQKEKKGVRAFGVCDVWDGNEEVQDHGGRGLYPSAKKCGLKDDDKEHVTKDYRKLLDNKDVDVVCVASPDHWHAKMSIDAAEAGKDVYCEKPMTRTIDEAHAVVDAMKKNNRVMTVGVQSMADPPWQMAYDYIKNGGIGHVAQAQTSYYRNYLGGQWRYYALLPQMNPKTVDWDMFLGHGA